MYGGNSIHGQGRATKVPNPWELQVALDTIKCGIMTMLHNIID